MKTKTRNILLIAGVIVTIFAGLLAYAGYRTYSFFSAVTAEKEIPGQIKEPGVLKGAGFLTKSEIFKLPKEGFLTTLGKGTQANDEKERQKIIQSNTARSIYSFADLRIFGEEIVAAGEFGAYVFDLKGNLKREILFEPTAETITIAGFEQEVYRTNLDNLKIVALEKNRFGFASHGSVDGFTLYDENGNRIWNYGKEKVDLSGVWQDEKQREANYEKSTHVLAATVGDLDGDGVAEYVVARKSDGIRAFDRGGSEKWFEQADFPSGRLVLLDTDGDGKNELLEIGNNSKIRQGETGKIIREIKGANAGDAFFFTEGQDKKKSLAFCDITDNKLVCKDEAGKSAPTATAPLSDVPNEKPRKLSVPGGPDLTFESESIYDPQIVRVRLRKDRPEYLAVVGAFIGIPRANFYLYDDQGALVYHELLPENAETIAVLPAVDAGEQILIGGKDTIWRFASE